MAIFGLSNSVGKTSGLPSGGGGFAVNAYFLVSQLDQAVYKILPDGTTTTFKDYSAGVLEPYGCAVDSANGRLFVMCGDTAAQYQVDRFDDLSVDTLATAAKSISSHTAWGGKGRYVYSTDEVWWATTNGTPDGIHKMDGDLTTYANVYTASDFQDVENWALDTEVYAIETTSTDQLYSGELDGSSWAALGSATGFTVSLLVPPAHQTGTNEYLMISDRLSNTIRRYLRTTTAGNIIWLDLGAATAIKLFPADIRYNFADNTIVFLGYANGGTGVDGIYSVPIQEGLQVEGNLTLIKDVSALMTGNATSGSGLGIWYSATPVAHRVDILV